MNFDFICNISLEFSKMGITFAYELRLKSFLYEKSSTRKVTSEFPGKTKCETLVDSCSQQPFFSLFPSPLLARKHHLETFESRTARALAPFVILLLVSMLI